MTISRRRLRKGSGNTFTRTARRTDVASAESVNYESSDDNGPPEWSIVLHIGLLNNVSVGRTRDDVQASIVAARIASIIGKQVSAWR